MTKTIPYKPQQTVLGGKSSLCGRTWPNGETSIWKARTFKSKPIKAYQEDDRADYVMSAYRLFQESRLLLEALASPLGLSLLPIFDKLKRDVVLPPKSVPPSRATKGLRGITSYGKRMVRNAAHLIENEVTKGLCVFATCTVPSLPREKLRIIHDNWHSVVEIYRLGLRRVLQKKGLSGESVTVSEIQEKRYERTGLPVLHIHSVFVGVTAVGKFAVTTEDHDRIWHAALAVAVDIERDDCASACNLQRVKKSASGYLAKYISKGVKSVQAVIDDGLGGWLPKHWWNCSRSLAARVKSQTRRIDTMASWLHEMAEESGVDYWIWHRDVVIDMGNGHLVTMARYGQLSIRQNAEVHAYYSD